MTLLADAVRDMKHGVRLLRRQPGFAATAILSLALGTGLSTTLFSVVNAVLLRDGHIAAPDRLVEIYSSASADFPQLTSSYPDFLDLRSSATALEGLAAHSYVRGILSSAGRPALVTGEAVSANYFDLLGIRLPLGRAFLESEASSEGTDAVVVLSHGVWQQQFGGRASIVGEQVSLSSRQYTVIGVAPPGYGGTIPGIVTDFWVPLTMVESLVFSGVQWSSGQDPGRTRLDRRGTHWLFLKGRLASGRTVDDARAQIETIFARLSAAYPTTNENVTTSVVPVSSIRFHPMIPLGERRKLEFDMGTNERAVDRVMPESIGGYPVNYGFVPQTVSYDGDPFDALVLGPPLGGGDVVRGVIVGVMYMEDEKGLDSKVVLSTVASDGRPQHVLTNADRQRIGDFFRRYKLHETGTFSTVPGWGSPAEGKQLVSTTHAFFQKCRNRTGMACRIGE